MIKTQRWRPSTTCGCSVTETWDDANTSVPHALSAFEAKCALHAALTDAAAYAALRDENPRWMLAFEEVRKLLPLRAGMTQAESDAWYAERVEQHYRGTYNSSRVLVVEVLGVTLTGGQKAQLRNALTSRLGTGKATVS